MLQNRLRKEAMRKVDFVLAHHKAIEEAVMEVRLGKVRPKDENIGGGRPSTTSDPTASAAIANATPLKMVTLRDGTEVMHPEIWLAVFNKTHEQCDGDERRVFEARFLNGKSAMQIEMDHGMPRSTYFYVVKLIRRFIYELALQAGLVKVA